MPRVLLPLAPGFEEIEAVTIVDVLRRAGVEVVVASLADPGPVEGGHGIVVHATTSLAALRTQSFDLIVLPGGEPGTTALAADAGLRDRLREHAARGLPLAAICAAPRVLAAAGLLAGRAATSHPSVEPQVRAAAAHYRSERVVRDGPVLTSRGPGTALEFALALLGGLGLEARAEELRRAMLVAGTAPD